MLKSFHIETPIKFFSACEDGAVIYKEAVDSFSCGQYNASIAMSMFCLKMGLCERYLYYKEKDPLDFYNLIWWAQSHLHGKMEDGVFRMLRGLILPEKLTTREDSLETIRYVSGILGLLYE